MNLFLELSTVLCILLKFLFQTGFHKVLIGRKEIKITTAMNYAIFYVVQNVHRCVHSRLCRQFPME